MMPGLPEIIKQYYFDNISLLSEDKKFHFASRLAAWEGDVAAFALLEELRPFICDDPNSKVKELLTASPDKGKRNAHELRQPVFRKYPPLYGLHLALFRLRHLRYIYGLDAQDILFAQLPQAEIEELIKNLIADPVSMRILATFGVNTIYLYGLILQGRRLAEPEYFLDISQGYDTRDKQQLQLMIYLFTHCIIGESNFYVREVPAEYLPAYKKMLASLEPLIETYFDDIHLDNKLEFLVCCRICDYQSPLFARVYAECQKSLSPKGHFLVDTHNSNAQVARASFVKSEHRNVLFLMSQTPFKPHSRLLAH